MDLANLLNAVGSNVLLIVLVVLVVIVLRRTGALSDVGDRVNKVKSLVGRDGDKSEDRSGDKSGDKSGAEASKDKSE